MTETVIIGAGPAGLTTAYELSKSGKKSIIIEADNQVGGLSRTANFKGYRFDIGGHRFFTKIPYIKKLWDELLGNDLVARSRISRIYYQGNYFDYPLNALNAVSNLGVAELFLIGLSFLKVKLLPHKKEDNFEQWVSNRFGSRLFEIFFKTYTEKVWGMSCKNISSDWAAQRIANLTLSEAFKNAFIRNNKAGNNKVIKTLINSFHYPRLGPGTLWDRCLQRLEHLGHDILFGTTINRIHHHNGRIVNIFAQSANDERIEIDGDNFISSMSLRDLLFGLDPAAPDDILRIAKRLRYRDYLTVLLIVNQKHIFPDNWLYIHSPDVKVGRIQNYKNWDPGMVPDPDKSSLGLEYFLWRSEDEWNWSQDQLIDRGIKECAKLGLINPEDVEDGQVIRMENAYPVYDRDYKKDLHAVQQYLERFSNFQTVGRNGLHRYNNQDHSMLTGVCAARNLNGSDYDIWEINTEQEHHEENLAAYF